ncbi:MAG: hypothetical protein ACRCZ0_08340 [Cetobacterium sp.]
MNKYNVLVGLVVGLKDEDSVYTYENSVEFYTCDLMRENRIEIGIRREEKKYKLFIGGVEDSDISSSEAKELYIAIEKEQERRLKERKRLSWASLGVING